MPVIERNCDKSRNNLLTISRKELIDILRKQKIKGISNKKKMQLCKTFIKLQKKTIRKKTIGKKKIRFEKKPEVREVKKYKNISSRLPSQKLKNDPMFSYCMPEVFSKYNLWLKEDVDAF